LGRRRLVARTPARRVPSVRMRPGPGATPAPVPGRPRTTLDAATVVAMRGAPREIYRVYGEREYMDGATSEIACAAAGDRVAGDAVHGRLGRRVASVVLLMGAAGVVAGVVAYNTLPQLRVATRRRVVRLGPPAEEILAASSPSVATRTALGTAAAAHSSRTQLPGGGSLEHVATPHRQWHAGVHVDRPRGRFSPTPTDVPSAPHLTVSTIAVLATTAAASRPAATGRERQEFSFER
jgi:hypothetical protein